MRKELDGAYSGGIGPEGLRKNKKHPLRCSNQAQIRTEWLKDATYELAVSVRTNRKVKLDMCCDPL
jgi:hypothetical protein